MRSCTTNGLPLLMLLLLYILLIGGRNRKERARVRISDHAFESPPVPLAAAMVGSRVVEWADAKRASRPVGFSDGKE